MIIRMPKKIVLKIINEIQDENNEDITREDQHRLKKEYTNAFT
jgi:hypothetical protein